MTDFVIDYTVLSFHCTVQLHHISLHLKQAGYLSVSLPATLNSSTSPHTLLSLSIRAEEETACWGYITICIALLSFCSPGKVLDILIQASYSSTFYPKLLNMTTDLISSSQVNDFDYVIVGGGTAGCVIASRLSEYLPQKKILLVEAGPSDFNDDRVLKLKEWLTLLGGDLDYDYGTTEQPMGRNI